MDDARLKGITSLALALAAEKAGILTLSQLTSGEEHDILERIEEANPKWLTAKRRREISDIRLAAGANVGTDPSDLKKVHSYLRYAAVRATGMPEAEFIKKAAEAILRVRGEQRRRRNGI